MIKNATLPNSLCPYCHKVTPRGLARRAGDLVYCTNCKGSFELPVDTAQEVTAASPSAAQLVQSGKNSSSHPLTKLPANVSGIFYVFMVINIMGGFIAAIEGNFLLLAIEVNAALICLAIASAINLLHFIAKK